MWNKVISYVHAGTLRCFLTDRGPLPTYLVRTTAYDGLCRYNTPEIEKLLLDPFARKHHLIKAAESISASERWFSGSGSNSI